MTHLATPVVLFIYRRSETSLRVLHRISQVKPSKLFLIADGPKGENEKKECFKTRRLIEDKIDWECKLRKVYAKANLGLAKRIQTGLDTVFNEVEKAIILEDDTLPDLSFFKFCEELLIRYENDKRIAHISGCNFHTDGFEINTSYLFSSIINVWGWATWKRSWINFNISMPTWQKIDKNKFLSKWCVNKTHLKGTLDMFELHCNNNDPWAWSYQWIFACWEKNALSILPKINLVSNIGIGPSASNTKSETSIDYFPSPPQKLIFPLKHTSVNRNTNFEIYYYKKEELTLSRKFKNLIKSIINKF